MTLHILPIEGMTCQGCVASLTRALQAVPGVSAVTVSLERAEARVDADPTLVPEAALRAAVVDAGFGLR